MYSSLLVLQTFLLQLPWTKPRLETPVQTEQHLFIGISFLWRFPDNKSWEIKGNLFILCIVLPINHNYIQKKKKITRLFSSFYGLASSYLLTPVLKTPSPGSKKTSSRHTVSGTLFLQVLIHMSSRPFRRKITSFFIFFQWHYISFVFAQTCMSAANIVEVLLRGI